MRAENHRPGTIQARRSPVNARRLSDNGSCGVLRILVVANGFLYNEYVRSKLVLTSVCETFTFLT